jgi:hypothetical protein
MDCVGLCRSLLRSATALIELLVREGRCLRGINRNELLKVFRNPRILENSLDGTLRLAGSAVDALIRVDHEHAHIIPLRLSLELVVVLLLFDIIEAIYWANLYAGAVFSS